MIRKKRQTFIWPAKSAPPPTDNDKKYTGVNGLNFGINDFGKSAPYQEIYDHFNLNSENIISKIKKKL